MSIKTIKKIQIVIVSFLVFVFFTFNGACTYNKEDELYAQPCDTTVISYNNSIKEILQTNCLDCHRKDNYQSRGGGYNLEGYENAKSFSERILARAISENDPMPPIPEERLSSCKINQIRAWMNQGTKLE